MTDLVKYGYVVRGYLGVEAQDLTPELAKEFNLGGATGVLVGGVAPNGPAEMGGTPSWRCHYAFDGKEVRERPPIDAVGDRGQAWPQPGLRSCATVRPSRSGSSLARHRKMDLSALADQAADPQEPGALQGVVMIELSSQVRQHLKIPRQVQGAVVLDLHAYSAAAQAGLRPGDVIEAINRQDVRNADEVSRLTHNARDKRTLLRVWSNSGSHFLLVNESPAAPPGLYPTPEFVQRNAQNKSER